MKRLREALEAWRDAEKRHAHAVLCSVHPNRLKELADARELALHHVRIIVDGFPWMEE